ncbi:MAG: glycosyltransferase family 9 protein [Acidobacteria bacterium]|nr:glycosyltransferase family 9 protein [Acidobacteriota bacterium]
MKVGSSDAAAVWAEFHQLRERKALTPRIAARLAEQAAESCLAGELDEGAPLLCELATLDNRELASFGVDGIFRQVVESLADAFEPRWCDLYIRFFARVLDCCRGRPEACWLDERLRQCGLASEQDLIRRAVALRRPRRAAGAVNKVVVLSRVTLGADVAVTSVVLQKLMRTFPEARLVLLGSEKAGLLFAGESRVEMRPVQYPRSGGLLDRLAAWPVVADQVRQELDGPCLVIDPDSRLTQLGMLPVTDDEAVYHFFESRSFSKLPLDTLADLTGAWLEEVFGPDPEPLRPWVSLPAEAKRFARAARASAPQSRWVAINLGVGENAAKRIEGWFEARLLDRLLASGWRIFLDKGEGEAEIGRADRLLADLRAQGWQVAEMEETGSLPPPGAHAAAWRGSLAGFGALIGESDLYIGYDSACQHIAAALGVKTIDIFAGFRSPRMAQRWRPSGPAEVRMIVVDPRAPADPETILEKVLEAAQ